MINIVQLGLGPIGQQLTRYLVTRDGISIVGGVDPDPQKTGKDLGTHAGLEKMGIKISPDIKAVPGIEEADVAVITTLSSLEKVEPQIQEVAEAGLDIVSTCEELADPRKIQSECAERIDQFCHNQGISCLGTGVNPGFLMDYLPSVLTSVCRDVASIKVERIQNAAPRRKPFRDKIGVGLTDTEFEEKRDSIRHVGLEESVRMIAHAMNWELDNFEESLEPVKAEKEIMNEEVEVRQGQNAGVKQVGRGFVGGDEVITLIFKAAVGIGRPHDTIHVTGTPNFTSTIEGGINGDVATAAITVNAIRSVQAAGPGLKTMLDIPVPSYYSEA